MRTAELQIDLIHKITGITDEAKLREILQLLQFQSNKSIFKTSKADKKAITEAKKQNDDGKTFNNEKVQKEIQECLNK
ncbi:MAG TPA: hypothetical protein VK021_07395 [Flavobacteriaceae bacterium]|nr:hypothetical protein [Flavobacteriaceae bacterium]